MQALRFSHRIAGPIYRITKSLQQVRSGDIGFRVHLRQGDHLTEIAAELNLLLDWLNANPPAGVRTGGDVVQLEGDESADVAGELHGDLQRELHGELQRELQEVGAADADGDDGRARS